MKRFFCSKNAVTKMQGVIIAVIIAGAAIAGGAYYYFTLPEPPPAKEEIVIGWAHGITGYLAPQVQTLHIYYKWIIEDYNEKGGLYVPEYDKRLPISYIEYDDESSIEKTLSLTEKLITVDEVDLIFAPCSTAFAFAAFPLYEQYNYPVIAVSFGSDIAAEKMRTGEYNYSFSVLGLPGEVGSEMTDLFQHINTSIAPLTSVGIIYHADQHGVEYSSAMYTYLTMAGFQVLPPQSYPPTIASFIPLVNDLKDANVDVAILCGYEGADFIHTCMTQDFNPKLLVIGPSMETPALVYGPFGFTHDSVKGVAFYDGWPATAYNTPELEAWANEHVERWGPIPGLYDSYPYPASATFYASLECVFQAVEKVGLDREKIRDALVTETFDTIIGEVKIRPGYSMQCELGGTITQWQGRDVMDVIWPLDAKSGDIIYPKPAWPSG
ncbi:MAG: ABC transporter substrate-binding protein [Candidatus Hodarchaeota archaeon]